MCVGHPTHSHPYRTKDRTTSMGRQTFQLCSASSHTRLHHSTPSQLQYLEGCWHVGEEAAHDVTPHAASVWLVKTVTGVMHGLPLGLLIQYGPPVRRSHRKLAPKQP